MYSKPALLGSSITLLIISTIAVALRYESRRIKKARIGSDDWTILAAWVLALAETIVFIICIQLGNLTDHIHFTPEGIPANPHAFEIFGKSSYIVGVFAWPCIGLTKISVLLLYRRIFYKKFFHMIVWLLVAVSIAATVSFTFAVAFSCKPIASHWEPFLPSHCLNEVAIIQGAMIVDVILDGFILILPVYDVSKLQMPLRQKLALLGIFSLGGFTTVTGLIRLKFTTAAYKNIGYTGAGDITRDFAPGATWTIIEAHVGVLSACLPTLRPLFAYYSPAPLLSKFSRTPHSGSSIYSLSSTDGQTGQQKQQHQQQQHQRLHTVEEGLTTERYARNNEKMMPTRVVTRAVNDNGTDNRIRMHSEIEVESLQMEGMGGQRGGMVRSVAEQQQPYYFATEVKSGILGVRSK